MKVAHSELADRISDKLGPVHRGVIAVGENVVAFGNDDYEAHGVAKYVHRFGHWLRWRGWKASRVTVCADKSTWVIRARPKKTGMGTALHYAERSLWYCFYNTPNKGRTTQEAGPLQRDLAYAELRQIGGGYTDETLETPLKGKANRVRGNYLINTLMLAKAAEDGTEDVHVLLGGVPFPAKIVVMDPVPAELGPPGYTPATVPEWLELAVPTEDVGDPRSDENHHTATAFIAAGNPLMVRHFGARHETTGRRIVVPVNPLTGEALPD